MQKIYFSFFGAVAAPDGAEVQRFCWGLPEWKEWERLEASLRNRQPIWVQVAGGIYAAAYRTRKKGVVWLVVECPDGGWAEVGKVFWPIQFLAPAAIAGACCAPRYGLRYDEVPPNAKTEE